MYITHKQLVMSILFFANFYEGEKMFFEDECKNVIYRIVKSYGLNTIKALGEKWGISAGVMASRVQRNTFPYDYVLRCALETGADIKWLCMGEGSPNIEGLERKSIQVSVDDLDKLERIGALKKDNLITESEYQLLKNSIFNN